MFSYLKKHFINVTVRTPKLLLLILTSKTVMLQMALEVSTIAYSKLETPVPGPQKIVPTRKTHFHNLENVPSCLFFPVRTSCSQQIW